MEAGTSSATGYSPVTMRAACLLGLLTVLAPCAGLHANAAMLNVQYGGCAAVSSGPVCELPDNNTLTLWVEARPGATVAVMADGAPPARMQTTRAGVATRYVIVLKSNALALSVTATTRSASKTWQLSLRRDSLPAQLSFAKARYREGQLQGARSVAEKYLGNTAEDGDDRYRGYALGLLGRIARRQNQIAEAKRQLTNAVTAHLEAGRYSEALNDASVLAFTLLYAERDFAGARASLALPGTMAQSPAESRYYSAYYRGLIEMEAGNPRAALPLLDEAAQLAESMAWQRLGLSAEQALASQLQKIGRHARAHAIFTKWHNALPADLSTCEQANFLTNTGWAALLMLEAGKEAEDPSQVLDEALRRNDKSCPSHARANAHINLALAHFHAGRLARAQAALDAVAAGYATPALRVALWWHDIAARVALASGDTANALAQLDKLEQIARLTLSGDAQWRAAVRKAELYVHLGDEATALRYFEQARLLRADELTRVPMDEGRGHVLAIRAQAFNAEMNLLLGANRHADAMQLLRKEQGAELRLLASPSSEMLASAGFYAEYEQVREHMLSLVESLWTLPVDALEQASTLR